MKRDANHKNLFMIWITQHNPFSISDNLISISLGVVGDSSVTCDLAVEKGRESMKKLMGKTFSNVVIPRKARVIPLACITSSLKIRGNVVKLEEM